MEVCLFHRHFQIIIIITKDCGLMRGCVDGAARHHDRMCPLSGASKRRNFRGENVSDVEFCASQILNLNQGRGGWLGV